MNKLLVVVAAALINEKNEILLAQRPQGKRLAGKWEFPGGKIEPDESPQQALIRELHEELGIIVKEADLEAFWFLAHDYVAEFGFYLLMPVFICRKWQNIPQALEHQALCWRKACDMNKLDMIEADAELVAKLQQL